MTSSFIAAGLNQETARRGKEIFGRKKQTAPAQTQPFYGLFVHTSAVCIGRDGLSFQQAVDFQRIDEVFLRQHPVSEGQWAVRQFVAKKFKSALPHHTAGNAGRERLRLLNG